MTKFPFYTGKGKRTDERIDLPNYKFPADQGDKYIPDEELVTVANVALLLRQPLLITGDPGVGKTQFAYSLGWELNLKVYTFETKSTSIAQDLFYTYDTLRRFHDAQLQDPRLSTNYITYNALGYAILRSHPYEKVKKYLPSRSDTELKKITDSDNSGTKDSEIWDKPCRSVVLIDEIDKAPRDFPNDLLNEIENKFFRIPELGTGLDRIAANDDLSPIIVITSNSEKALPEAFLRRCIYYNLKFPHKNLEKIIESHIPALRGNREFMTLVIGFFEKIHKSGEGSDRKPSISEFKDWLVYLSQRGINSKNALIQNKDEVLLTYCTMAKTNRNSDIIRRQIEEWLDELKEASKDS